MKKLVLLFVLCATPAMAQPTVEPGSDKSFAWDYTDALMNAFSVEGFEIRIDGGNPSDVGKVRLGTMESYFTPIPAVNTGNHIMNVRAYNLNNDGTNNPGAWSADFNFSVSVFEAPINTRIIDTPEAP